MRAHLRDTSKWYDFQDIGHEMQDYTHLKKEIEDLLSKEYLGDILGNDNRRTDYVS